MKEGDEIAIVVTRNFWDPDCKDYELRDVQDAQFYVRAKEGEIYDGRVLVLALTSDPVPATDNPSDGYMLNKFYYRIVND